MKTDSKEKPDLKDVARIEKKEIGEMIEKKEIGEMHDVFTNMSNDMNKARAQIASSCMKLSSSINSDIDAFNKNTNILADLEDLDGYATKLIEERGAYFKEYTEALARIEHILSSLSKWN